MAHPSPFTNRRTVQDTDYLALLEQVRAEAAKGVAMRDVIETLGITRPRLHRMTKRYGIVWQLGRNSARPMLVRALPDDFAYQAGRMGFAEVTRHYGASRQTIARWYREADVPRPAALRRAKAAAKPFARVAAPTSVPGVRFGGPPGPVNTFQRDMSDAGRAADFLRRLGPIWRCDERGRPSPTGSHWRRGSAILTGDELIERAASRGFEPSRWAA